MKRVLKSSWAWVAAATALLIVWMLSARLRGELMARLDHARGHHEVQFFGYCIFEEKYRHLLAERYGVRLRRVAGCSVWPWEANYVEGYNDVSIRLLTEKHGQDVVEECRQLAQTAEAQ